MWGRRRAPSTRLIRKTRSMRGSSSNPFSSPRQSERCAHLCFTLTLLHTTLASHYPCCTLLLLHTTLASHHPCFTPPFLHVSRVSVTASMNAYVGGCGCLIHPARLHSFKTTSIEHQCTICVSRSLQTIAERERLEAEEDRRADKEKQRLRARKVGDHALASITVNN